VVLDRPLGSRSAAGAAGGRRTRSLKRPLTRYGGVDATACLCRCDRLSIKGRAGNLRGTIFRRVDQIALLEHGERIRNGKGVRWRLLHDN
jgi:hypothetical protein